MPTPIASAALAIIEFTMVRHWFVSLTTILGFTTLDETRPIGF
jgi:hypothetical protein